MGGVCFSEYQWQDERGRKVRQSAPLYIDHIMSLVQKSVMDESLFPTKFGKSSLVVEIQSKPFPV